LVEIQTKYNEIINSNLINEILENGKAEVTPIANQKLKEVSEKIGILI